MNCHAGRLAHSEEEGCKRRAKRLSFSSDLSRKLFFSPTMCTFQLFFFCICVAPGKTCLTRQWSYCMCQHNLTTPTLTGPFEHKCVHTTSAFIQIFQALWQAAPTAHSVQKQSVQSISLHPNRLLLSSVIVLYGSRQSVLGELHLTSALHWIKLIWFEPVMNLIGFAALLFASNNRGRQGSTKEENRWWDRTNNATLNASHTLEMQNDWMWGSTEQRKQIIMSVQEKSFELQMKASKTY